MTGLLYRMGGACSRRWGLVLAVWGLVAVATIAAAGALGSQASDDISLPGTDSQQATDLLKEGFPDLANGNNPIVLKASTGEVTDQRYRQGIDDSVSALRADPDVAQVVSPLDPQGAGQVSKGGTVAYIAVYPARPLGQLTVAQAQHILDHADAAKQAGLQTSAGAQLGNKLSKPDTHSSEVVGLVMALIVLAFTFGSLVAMGLPIASALVGVFVGLAGITLLTHVTTVPTSATTLALMLGLGCGIDYALFLLTTHRDSLVRGMDLHESVARAVATSGGAVLFAGSTVVVAMCSLAVAGIPILTTLGLTTALMVALAVIVALTLLPAILGALGHRVTAAPLPGRRPDRPVDVDHSVWARFADWILRHPWTAVVISLAILVPLIIPAFSLQLGQQDVGALPEDTTARQAYDHLTDGFGVGQNGPLVIASRLPSKTTAADPALTGLARAVQGTKGVASVTPVVVDQGGTIANLTAIPTTAPSDFATEDLVNTLRDTTIPAAIKGTGVRTDVGGSTAAYIDLAEEISGTMALVVAVIIGLSFILLMLAFRSVLIPLKAAAMNLLSIGAAYGVVVMTFQWGWFTSLVGLEGDVPIVSYLPLLMFAGLFGLSMDYEVFLMSHVQDHYRAGASPHRAVVRGLAESAKVITAAALIMVSVFASFILNGDPTIKQFGVGLSVAVILDATVVRCLLVPAVMALMGRTAWWFPAWADRHLPRISVEGTEYFAERDAAADPAGAAPACG